MKRLRYVFLILVLTSCSNKPPEIVEFERAEVTGLYYGGFFKEERFIVFNHPKNQLELTKLINDFNRETMTKDSVLKYNKGYLRIFYKKTYNTMEAYNENKEEESTFFNIAAYDDMEKYNSDRQNAIIRSLEKYCRDAHLLSITWIADNEQRISIHYYVNDYKTIRNVSDDELFNLK